MCYNCGCGMPNNDMGKAENITSRTFEAAANAMDQPVTDAKRNARELLEKVLAAKEESDDKNWKP
jgi:vacuolar-type H+-ATPase subunit H